MKTTQTGCIHAFIQALFTIVGNRVVRVLKDLGWLSIVWLVGWAPHARRMWWVLLALIMAQRKSQVVKQISTLGINA
jgi:hypothetical protein